MRIKEWKKIIRRSNMKKIIIVTLILLLMTTYLLSFDIESLQTSLVPETAKWFVHIDVARLAASKMKKIFTDNYDSDIEREILGIEKTANIDFFKDITAVTAIGTEDDKGEPVIAFSGNLNKDHLLSLLKKETYDEFPYGDFFIYNWDGNDYGCFVNDKLLLIGESEKGLKKVLDTYSGKEANILSTALASELKSLSPDVLLLAVADDILGLIDEDDNDFGSLLLKKTKRAFLTAAEIKDRLNLKLSLEADSAETAKNMLEMANGLRAFLAMNEEIDPEWEFIKSLKIGSKGSTVVLESDSSIEELLSVLLGKKEKKFFY
jgi:hypothetical protein